MAGDVIGCCIDLDEGTISYSRFDCYPLHYCMYIHLIGYRACVFRHKVGLSLSFKASLSAKIGHLHNDAI